MRNIKLKSGFEELDIKAIPLHTQFKRMQEDILKKCGISMEGANLSGLDEEPSDPITLMCNMAEEVAQEKQTRDDIKQKKAEKNKAMTMIEKLQLVDQGRVKVKNEDNNYPESTVKDAVTKSSNSA